jgi:23S rRNA (cytosine1962-C5)-methyltransferase
MFEPDQYQLVDFGDARKLERFGPYLLDRPCPAAEGCDQENPQLWKTAAARYERGDSERGKWNKSSRIPPTWSLPHEDFALELKLTPFGHVGVFAEQSASWDWIARQAARANRPLRVLNLFAYTGGSSLAAAAAGCEVTHVDAAKNVVAWARSNAANSGLQDAPIRWITEDAGRFVERELRRGNTYDAVVMDPPSYGHGPKGEVWEIGNDLAPLLKACGQLTKSRRAFILLSCHSPGFGPAELEAALADAIFGHCQGGVVARSLSLVSADGNELSCGAVARWPG